MPPYAIGRFDRGALCWMKSFEESQAELETSLQSQQRARKTTHLRHKNAKGNLTTTAASLFSYPALEHCH